jgi:uncharacterized membrane protein YfhO
MKNISIALLILVCCLYSCEKTGAGKTTPAVTPETESQQALIGKWTVSKVTVTTFNKNSSIPANSKTVSTISKQWEFKTDGSLLVQEDKSSSNLTYRVSSPNKITIVNGNEIQEVDLKIQTNKIVLSEMNLAPDGTSRTDEIELTKMN